jgi:hypothetical protein
MQFFQQPPSQLQNKDGGSKENLLGFLGNALRSKEQRLTQGEVKSSMNGGPADLRNKFKANNGVWDKIELGSESVRHLAYKIRLALGVSWSPIIEKVFKISPPFSMRAA